MNSLGLDVHGAVESQDQGQPSDTTGSSGDSWGILVNTPEQDGSKNVSWGQAGEVSWGVAPGEDSWGQPVVTDTWEVPVASDNWGPPVAEDSWGPPEASTTPKDDRSKKDKDNNWGKLGDEGGTSPTQKDDKPKKDKGTPYVPAAPPARTKMSPDELAERMEKIRLQNEKIKERREHVKADEEAFNTSLAVDHARQAANRRVQAQVDQNREQNAKRKLEKMGNREWDSGKHGGEWKQSTRGRGNSSFGSSKNRGRQHSTATSRNPIDISSVATNESDISLSLEEPPHTTSQNSIDSSQLHPDTRDVEKHD